VTVAAALDLHVPDEPTGRAAAWRRALHEGRDIDEVLSGDDGVTTWVWSRWRAPLAASGLDEDALGAIVAGYRRELRLWLEGDRTWAQCCSGLIGRITRRVGSGDPAEV
jgi:hypothetical protein